jgi:tetratricopeptide (TPR) repeat protein
MAILFKCKMCGGNLEVEQGSGVGTCVYCGSVQTLPKLDDERRATLYDRANHYRRSGDYDKAAGIFETILNEDPTDAEAYWSLVLCRYGIEYVEDPQSGHRVPTCNRTLFASILQDADYLQALAHADGAMRGIYEQEAAAIDAIQKGILAISASEQPYDVFICFKETADDGSRTRDSVLAQDIYHQLSDKGYRVFFSRITLEGKLGEQYEPYIFAALNSARVMFVVGTRPEYFNAVWVKNEWSRFLALAQTDRSKLLIPCYRDMDVYDLPQELAMLQSQDMAKLGFMQDLLRGVEKIVRDAPAQAGAAGGAAPVASAVPTASSAGAAPGVESLHKRMLLFLEDNDFTQASEYADRILDIDPEYAPAYMGKFCAENSLVREEMLCEAICDPARANPFESGSWIKAYRFADDELRRRLGEYKATAEKNTAEVLAHPLTWDGSGSYGGVDWLPLTVSKGKVLVVRKDIVVTLPYDQSLAKSTWETCSLRAWLNGEYLNRFPLQERVGILEANLSNPDNPQYGTSGGKSTHDKIFLLSIDEVKRFFPSDQSRIANYNGKAFWWWLRSAGSGGSRYAAVVSGDGGVYTYGYYVVYDDDGVRPALWLNLNPEISDSQALQANPAVLAQKRQEEKQRKAAELRAKQEVEAQRRAAKEARQREEQARIWESQGLCRYCGGSFGMFGKKCKSCGRHN